MIIFPFIANFIIPIDFHIFQRGKLNHQPIIVFEIQRSSKPPTLEVGLAKFPITVVPGLPKLRREAVLDKGAKNLVEGVSLLVRAVTGKLKESL